MTLIPLTDVDLYVDTVGTGRPVLFVHGWATSARVWDAVVASTTDRYRSVALDWRGCGRSSRPAAGNTIEGVVADLAELIETLELDPPVVVGSSIGAVFALQLAVDHPLLVAGSVLVDSPGFWPARGMDVASILGRATLRRAELVSTWVPNWFAPGTARALIDHTIAQILDSGPFVAQQFGAFGSYDPRPLLAGLTRPVHYIHGELDAQIPVAVSEECAALTPGGRVITIPGSGHMPHQEQPELFIAALDSLIADIDATVPVPAA